MQLPTPIDEPCAPFRMLGYPTGPAPRTAFLHGVLCSNALWRPLARQALHERSVALPLPGHFPWALDGPRTAGVLSGSAFLEAYRRIILDLCDGPVRIVAHSTGALVAMKFAARFPELVSRLILVGAFPCGRDEVRRSASAMSVLLPTIGSPIFRGLYRSWLHSPLTFSLGLTTTNRRGRAADGLRESDTAMLADLRRSDPAALREVVRWIARTSLIDELENIEVPVTVLVSQDDNVVDAKRQLELAARIPNATATLCHCGHLPMLEAPDLLRRVVFGSDRFVQAA